MGGAAGGHMSHPFDCPEIKTGKNLIDFMEKTVDWLADGNEGSVKIDGINTSFRLRTNDQMPTGFEFVVDRGSSAGSNGKLDLEGVTAEVAHTRWKPNKETGEAHGMALATEILLDIFNNALPDILPELEQIGMTRRTGPLGYYFNTEFVSKDIGNVKKYKDDFIALHGVREFVQATPKRRSFLEVPTDQALIDAIRDKVTPHAEKLYGFLVESRVGAKLKPDVKIDLNKHLNIKYTVVYEQGYQDPDDPEDAGIGVSREKTLREWLSAAINPKGKKVAISDKMIQYFADQGKSISKMQDPTAKTIYQSVLGGMPLHDMFPNEDESALGVDGAFFWQGMKVMGNEILLALETKFGEAAEEEGLVIQDDNICGGTMYKITGEFIDEGMTSVHQINEVGEPTWHTDSAAAKTMSNYQHGELPPEEEKEEEKETFIPSDVGENYVILIPGGFKPPTAGHYDMIKQYEEKTDVYKVFVITGPKPRDGITLDQSKKIFGIYGGFGEKVEFITSRPGEKTPLESAYELIKDPEFSEIYPEMIFSLGSSSKKDKKGAKDSKRIREFVEYFERRPGLLKNNTKVGYYEPAEPLESGGEVLSASRMRKALEEEDWETFKLHLPEEKYFEEVKNLLSGQLQENFLALDSVYLLVDQLLFEGKKNNCFDHDTHKTFESKASCIQKQKGWDKERANAYVASVEREKGNIEEYSAGGAGAVEGGSGKSPWKKLVSGEEEPDKREEVKSMISREEIMQEFKLRRLIRKAIRIRESKNKAGLLKEEQKLRKVIRKVLLEASPTADNDPAPHSSTGINVLEDLLKKIIPVIETDFRKLTSDGKQRESYRAHIIKATEDALAPQKAADKISADEEDTEKMLPINEEDVGIDIMPASEQDKFIDINPESMEQEEEPEDERDTFGIEGQDKTGRNVAYDTFKKIGANIIDAYDVLDGSEDKGLFYDYLITNLKLYFDKFENDMGGVEEPTTDEYESESEAGEDEAETPEGEEELETPEGEEELEL